MRELAHRQLISELGGRSETLKLDLCNKLSFTLRKYKNSLYRHVKLKRDAAKQNRAWQKPECEYNLAKVRERIGIPIWEIW